MIFGNVPNTAPTFDGAGSPMWGGIVVLLPYLPWRNIYAMPLRLKLDGHPVLSDRLNVETAGFERKRPEI
eukprot:COSAG06_NODE_8392_length_2188_cov_1.451891_2_plen_70_part_00